MKLATVALLFLFLVGCAFSSETCRAPSSPDSMTLYDPKRMGEFRNPQEVQIIGYDGDAMEPFITRDGRYLLFNRSNEPGVDTNLYYAERMEDGLFQFMGEIRGANATNILDATPSMDREGNFYFVSVRSYSSDYQSLYRGIFRDGTVSNVEAIPGNLSLRTLGWINMDVEVAPDGETLYFASADFSERLEGMPPRSSDIRMAQRIDGQFVVAEDSELILQNINRTESLEYGVSIPGDGLEIFFTRTTPGLCGYQMRICRAVRDSDSEPFGKPEIIYAVLRGDACAFAEAPSVTSDGRVLYYTARQDSGYRIFMVSREQA
jgi:hypothetical protein